MNICGTQDARFLWSMEEDVELARERVVNGQLRTDDEILAEAQRLTNHSRDPALLALVIARLRYGPRLARHSSAKFIMLPDGSVWSTYGTEGVIRCPARSPRAPQLLDNMWLQKQRRFGMLAAWVEYDVDTKECSLGTFEGAHDLQTIEFAWKNGGDVSVTQPVSAEQTVMSYVTEMDEKTRTPHDLRLLRRIVSVQAARLITGTYEWRSWDWLETPVKDKANKKKPRSKQAEDAAAAERLFMERDIVRCYAQGCIKRKTIEVPAFKAMKRMLGCDWRLIISRTRKEMREASRTLCGGTVTGDHLTLLECMAELANVSEQLERKCSEQLERKRFA